MSGSDRAHAFEVCMASAGTGKTFALTNRMAGLLARGVPVDRILAATFTRKAAGEIRERLLSRIARAAEDETQAAQLSEHAAVDLDRDGWLEVLQRLARGIHRIRIGTLDSLAQSLARSLAPELGLASPWHMAMDHASEQLRTHVIERVLAELHDQESIDLFRVLAGAEASASSDRKLADLLRDAGPMLRRAEPRSWACLESESQVGPSLEELHAAVERLASTPAPVNRSGKPDQRFAKAAQAIAEDVRTGQFERLLSRSLVCGCVEPTPTYYKVDVPAAWLQELRIILGGAVRHEIQHLHARNLAAGALVARAMEIDDAVRREQRTYALDDLWRALAATDLETQHVAYRLDTQYDHILLDEFQDTSIDQWRVLEPLIDEAVAGGERSRSVFVVGDIKQSLYGWRNAQAELLPHVARHWEQMHRSTLRVTYRCAPEIVDAVNRLFLHLPQNPALSGHTQAVAQFSTEFEAHASAVTPGALVRVVDIAAQSRDQSEDFEPARAIAERVACVHALRPNAEFAVLVRTQKTIGRVVAALAERGVRAVADASSSPCDHPAVEAVLAALHLSEHPGDGAAWYAVCNSPLGEALGCGPWNQAGRAQRIAEQVSGWIFEEGISRTVERLAQLSTGGTNARGRARLADLIAQGEAYEIDPPPLAGVDDFVQYARSARVRPHGHGLVRVLTLHGAKGLQFDAVFLADLDAPLAARMPAFFADAGGREERDPTADLTRLSLSSVQSVRAHSAVLSEMEHRWRARSVYEELCLLYVGMTRAKRHLEILVDASRKGLGAVAWTGLAGGADGLAEFGSDAWLRGGVLQAPDPVSASLPAWAEATSVPSTWKPPEQPWRVAIVQPSRLGEAAGVAQVLAGSPVAADLGTQVHKLLERVGWLEEAGEDPLEWADPSDPVGVEAVDRVREGLSAGSLRDVLSMDAIKRRWGPGLEPTVEREKPIAVVLEVDGRPALVRGRIDRLVVGRRADRVERALVVDFKTGHAGEAGAEQLDIYRRAVAKLLGLSMGAVECEIVKIGG